MKLVFMLCVSICLFAGEVKNGLAPQGKPMTLELKQNLVINADSGEDAYIWGATVVYDVDKNGNILLSDVFNGRVLLFDAKGKFVKEVAAKGAGPGEVQGPIAVGFLADGRMAVMDMIQSAAMSKVNFFDADGKFIEAKAGPNFVIWQNADFGPDGKTLAGMCIKINLGENTMNFDQVISDLDYNYLRNAGGVQRSAPNFQRFNEGAYWTEYLAENFKLILKLGIVEIGFDGTQYVVPNNKYEIQMYKPGEEKPFQVVTKEYKPIPNPEEEIMAIVEPIKDTITASLPPQMAGIVTEKVISDAIEQANFPPVKFPVYGIIDLDGPGFMVIRDVNIKHHFMLYDIFDKSGKYLGEFKMAGTSPNIGTPAAGIVVRNGNFHVLGLSENEEPQLTRYAYKLVPAK